MSGITIIQPTRHDFPSPAVEHGVYANTCRECGATIHGHKYRRTCRVCVEISKKTTSAPASKTS